MSGHVLFLSALAAVGGEELSTLSLSRELVGRGYDVSLIGTRGPLWGEFEKAGVALFDAGGDARTLRYRRNEARLIRRLTTETRVRIIHSQSLLLTLDATMATRFPGGVRVPVVHHHRGMQDWNYPVVSRVLSHLAAHVIANSDYERTRLIRHGMRAAHCRRIHNCANVDASAGAPAAGGVRHTYGLRDEAQVIGTVGRLTEHKNLPGLLAAFAIVRRECPRAVLLIVGDGHLREALAVEARRLQVEEAVIFAGARRDLENVYPSLDVFALASTFESLGNVAIEAAAFGKPVVATRVAGLPEAVLDGETGVLVPPRDVPALARALTRMLREPATAAAMGAAGRRRALAYFTPARVADEVEEVYRAVLGGGDESQGIG